MPFDRNAAFPSVQIICPFVYYPGLLRELQAVAAGVEGIGAKAAKRALEARSFEMVKIPHQC